MRLQVLMSSFENKIEEIHDTALAFNSLTVINQIPEKLNDKSIRKKINNVVWIDIDQKGLSKSRNLAISISEGEFIYLADDDIELKDDFEQIIYKSFLDNPNYDILAFDFERVNDSTKKKKIKAKDINYLTSMQLSSVQLVFKSNFFKKNKLYFDERFGAGAKYSMGEENIFLFDALKKNAKIKYIPKTIVKLHPGESTWFRGFNKEFFFDRGATYWRMFSIFAPAFSLVYCLRKRNLYKDNIGILTAFFHSIRGMKEFIVDNHSEETIGRNI